MQAIFYSVIAVLNITSAQSYTFEHMWCILIVMYNEPYNNFVTCLVILGYMYTREHCWYLIALRRPETPIDILVLCRIKITLEKVIDL